MSRPGFSITHIANQNYSTFALNVESKYEVLDIFYISDATIQFLIADDNGDFIRIRSIDCRLGELLPSGPSEVERMMSDAM